jgi:ADP-ribose 1''-phosphate phosphatase
MITNRTGNVFSAPPGSILIHSCNAQGVWGAGVALQMKNRYWEAFQDFKKWLRHVTCALTGYTRLLDRHFSSHSVASMVVSNGRGSSVDSPEIILGHTAMAIRHLLLQEIKAAVEQKRPVRELHSPRINAGLFNVPWEQTEAIIRAQLASFNNGLPFHGYEGRPFHWTVWTP